jgi:hypothetical protein
LDCRENSYEMLFLVGCCMFDAYEKEKWEKLQEERYLFMDALRRADDGLTEDRLDTDEWGYANTQLARAESILAVIRVIVSQVRHRRLAMIDGPATKTLKRKE